RVPAHHYPFLSHAPRKGRRSAPQAGAIQPHTDPSYGPPAGRPERAPKPSIDASVPSRDESCARTSWSHAKFCSLGSSPKARSASFSSLFNVRFLRCKVRTSLSTHYAATPHSTVPSATLRNSFASSANKLSALLTI